jgi:hypothetical protein
MSTKRERDAARKRQQKHREKANVSRTTVTEEKVTLDTWVEIPTLKCLRMIAGRLETTVSEVVSMMIGDPPEFPARGIITRDLTSEKVQLRLSEKEAAFLKSSSHYSVGGLIELMLLGNCEVIAGREIVTMVEGEVISTGMYEEDISQRLPHLHAWDKYAERRMIRQRNLLQGRADLGEMQSLEELLIQRKDKERGTELLNPVRGMPAEMRDDYYQELRMDRQAQGRIAGMALRGRRSKEDIVNMEHEESGRL